VLGWVLSMAVVEGLSAEQIAGRLEAEPGEETTGDSDSGEEAGAGPGLPAVGVHGDGRALILDEVTALEYLIKATSGEDLVLPHGSLDQV
jgi:hypothetical protein